MVLFFEKSGLDPVYGQSSSGTRFTTKMVWNVTWVVRPVQKHFFLIFVPLCMIANAFRPGKDEKKNHFDLRCQESLVQWTSRWVISCKIIKRFEMLGLITNRFCCNLYHGWTSLKVRNPENFSMEPPAVSDLEHFSFSSGAPETSSGRPFNTTFCWIFSVWNMTWPWNFTQVSVLTLEY